MNGVSRPMIKRADDLPYFDDSSAETLPDKSSSFLSVYYGLSHAYLF